MIHDRIRDPPLVGLDRGRKSRHLNITFFRVFSIHSLPDETEFQILILNEKKTEESKERKSETLEFLLGPPNGMEPGLRPTMMDGGDWTWRIKKDPGSDPGSWGRSLRLLRAHLRAFMLSSLPSTATTTHSSFPAISL